MKTVLVLYQSRSGHTARIARRIWETVIAEGNQADLMDVVEADREGLDWNKYDLVIAGAPVLYGHFRREFVAFVNKYKAVLDCKANSFFCVSVVARTPAKAHPGRQRVLPQVPREQPLEAEGRPLLRRQG